MTVDFLENLFCLDYAGFTENSGADMEVLQNSQKFRVRIRMLRYTRTRTSTRTRTRTRVFIQGHTLPLGVVPRGYSYLDFSAYKTQRNPDTSMNVILVLLL